MIRFVYDSRSTADVVDFDFELLDMYYRFHDATFGGFDSVNYDVLFRPVVFGGTLAAPHFINGVYAMNNGYDDGVLTISGSSTAPGAVPEPASWAMMIGGFGLLGGAMRRRVARVAVSQRRAA